jgi:hypothetical protein
MLFDPRQHPVYHDIIEASQNDVACPTGAIGFCLLVNVIAAVPLMLDEGEPIALIVLSGTAKNPSPALEPSALHVLFWQRALPHSEHARRAWGVQHAQDRYLEDIFHTVRQSYSMRARSARATIEQLNVSVLLFLHVFSRGQV